MSLILSRSEPPHKDIERTREWVSSMIKNEQNGVTDFVICLKPDNKPVGKMGIWSGDEIGFILNRSHWQKGLAVEAISKVLPYFFDVRQFDSISADTDPRNQASIGLLKRFGFEEDRYEENTFKIGDLWVHSLYLRLSKERWKQNSSG